MGTNPSFGAFPLGGGVDGGGRFEIELLLGTVNDVPALMLQELYRVSEETWEKCLEMISWMLWCDIE